MKEIITEEYSLPSKGLMYNKPFDPAVKLRSMTVAEEMKRLSPSETPYKVMSEIIESCLVTKLPIHVYDLCLCDYTYLLHKLRVTTYGPDYKLQYVCPKCGSIEKVSINLDNIKVNYFNKELDKNKIIKLPRSEKEVVIKYQTPRDLDRIETKKKELKTNFPEMEDPTVLLTVASFIESVDGESLDPIRGLEMIKQLPMMDVNFLVQKATKLNGKVGIDSVIKAKCSGCGNDVKTTFRYTSEFFGPAVD